MEALLFLTYLGIILLLGIICTIISKRLKMSNILLLIIVGIVIGNLDYKGSALMSFPEIFLISVGTLALVMVIFDSSSRFKFKEFDTFSIKALKLSIIFLFLNLIFLTIATKWAFNIESAFIAAVFAALISGTDPMSVMIMLKESKSKVIKMLEIESIINTPIIVLVPFMIIEFMKSVNVNLIFSKFVEQIAPFLQQFVSGIGAGILVGIIAFKIMRRRYSETLSPLALITAALLTYILAENLGGNGVLAVTVMGVIFGSFYVKEKAQLQEFSSLFANSLEILVFVLVGMIINIPFTVEFFIKSFSLFLVYLIIRFISISVTFIKEDYSLKEKIFMMLNAQKGIAVAVIAFMLFASHADESSFLYGIHGLPEILNLTLIFMIYSIIISTIVVRFSKYFIATEIKEEK